MVEHYTPEEIKALLPAGADQVVNRWIERGDGIAVYQNVDLGHPEAGHIQFVSFGSENAQLETEQPPERMPDIGGNINWRYILTGVYVEGVQL